MGKGENDTYIMALISNLDEKLEVNNRLLREIADSLSSISGDVSDLSSIRGDVSSILNKLNEK